MTFTLFPDPHMPVKGRHGLAGNSYSVRYSGFQHDKREALKIKASPYLYTILL